VPTAGEVRYNSSGGSAPHKRQGPCRYSAAATPLPITLVDLHARNSINSQAGRARNVRLVDLECRREPRKVEDRGAELPAANEGRMGTLVMQDDALPAVGRIIPARLVGRGPSQLRWTPIVRQPEPSSKV
jgi:hypothetical protein